MLAIMTKRDVNRVSMMTSGWALAAIWLAFVSFATLPLKAQTAQGDASKTGSVTKLPLPRFVSLKASEVNVRVGPGSDYAIAWVFRRAGLAVEIIQESDSWRQIRDSEGATGWVASALLSARRTGVVSPWSAKDGLINLLTVRDGGAAKAASVEPGAVVDIMACDGKWCEVYAGKIKGYLPQETLWGVYPQEIIE
jgi:SH3-like domain-containing protein